MKSDTNSSQTTMDQMPDIKEIIIIFIFILRYILVMLLKPRSYIGELHLKFHLVQGMFDFILDMSFMFLQFVSPNYIHPWPDVVKGKKKYSI